MPVTASPDLTTWIVVLCIQAVPYGCALLVSLASALRLPARLIGVKYRGNTATALKTPDVLRTG
jgi:hypothetical protein